MPDIRVLGSSIHYEDSGTGTALVFLHGNPSSSHMWRNIMPRVGSGRLLAPDLIGMGRSGKPDIPYSFADHARYLDAWSRALGLDRVVLIGHDWGGALACDWAARHPGQVLGVAFFESIVKPMAWEDLSPQARDRFEALRAPGTGEQMVLDQDLFIRQAFTSRVLTPVADQDLQAYLAPYPTPESRRPVLAWARQMPPSGELAEQHPCETLRDGGKSAGAGRGPGPALVRAARPRACPRPGQGGMRCRVPASDDRGVQATLA